MGRDLNPTTAPAGALRRPPLAGSAILPDPAWAAVAQALNLSRRGLEILRGKDDPAALLKLHLKEAIR